MWRAKFQIYRLHIRDCDWLNFIHFSGYKYRIRLVPRLKKREDHALISISTILKFPALNSEYNMVLFEWKRGKLYSTCVVRRVYLEPSLLGNIASSSRNTSTLYRREPAVQDAAQCRASRSSPGRQISLTADGQCIGYLSAIGIGWREASHLQN